jgi:hypothetical protein
MTVEKTASSMVAGEICRIGLNLILTMGIVPESGYV